jgi:serine/threonine protein kinase
MHNQLEHPNIVRLLNHFYEDEKKITYMVLEYVSGGTLFEKIKTSNIPKKTQCSIFRDVCSAIAAMHSNNIMHRDIKVQ